MSIDIILSYPEGTPTTRILDDINTVLRGSGGVVHSPTVLADDATDVGLAVIDHVVKQGRPAEAGTTGTEIGADQLLITSGTTVQCGADMLQFTIVDGACTDYAVVGGA